MRPGLRDVKRWFSADVVSDEQLAAYLSILRIDPNWRVTDTTCREWRALLLLYYPDGMPFDVVLDRTAEGWQPRMP